MAQSLLRLLLYSPYTEYQNLLLFRIHTQTAGFCTLHLFFPQYVASFLTTLLQNWETGSTGQRLNWGIELFFASITFGTEERAPTQNRPELTAHDTGPAAVSHSLQLRIFWVFEGALGGRRATPKARDKLYAQKRGIGRAHALQSLQDTQILSLVGQDMG